MKQRRIWTGTVLGLPLVMVCGCTDVSVDWSTVIQTFANELATGLASLIAQTLGLGVLGLLV